MHINLATEAADQAGQNEMLKEYLLFVKKKWETIEICPHPPPTDPLPGKAERSGNAVGTQWKNKKQKIEGDSLHRSRRGIKSFL